MRARVAFSPAQVEQRIYNSLAQSSESAESNASRGRIRNRRRGSYSQELERRRSKGTATASMEQGLRKARSSVSLENHPSSIAHDLTSLPTRSRAHRRSSAPFGDGAFEIECGSDEDNGIEFSFTSRPRLPKKSSLRDTSFYSETLGHNSRSPAGSRPSSFSGKSQRSGSGHRGSPKQAHAPSPHEVTMALSPSSRHYLNMTPSVQPSSPDSFTRTSCN
ncbi:hypothetical protein N7470_010366 [Penicillium chermesinum]|nr:hypothetical protein N7470_010366 [Penicillium chermesinum]